MNHLTIPTVLDVDCTACGAEPGAVCLTGSGKPTGPHAARRATYRNDDNPTEAAKAEAVPEANESTALGDLPATLTSGLTVWGDYGGAQIRLEPRLALDDHGNVATDDNGHPLVIDGPPVGALYLALGATSYAGHEGATDPAPDGTGGDPGLPVYRLDRNAARALRDLLNIATARGTL